MGDSLHMPSAGTPKMPIASLRSFLAAPPLYWTRRFALLALVCILVSAVTGATLLSRKVAESMVMRNAELAQEFMDSLVQLHHADTYFVDRSDSTGIEQMFGAVARMPGLVHAHVFDTQRKVVWSTKPDGIGRDAGANPELDQALGGRLEVESDLLAASSFIKPEHAFVPHAARDAIEVYIPVRNAAGQVMGVAELYMLPQRLIDSVHVVTRYVWLSALVGGLLTYVALVWLVIQADRQIQRQQRTIASNEALVAVGDMASAVAHGLRNPLASIRSSAELMAMGPEKEQATDVMDEVDRLQAWIRKLLAYAQQGGRELTQVDVRQLTEDLLAAHVQRISRQQVRVERHWPPALPLVQADAPAMEQALDNLISNAIEAMPAGGVLALTARADKRQLVLEVVDSGVGIAASDLERVFLPFHTTKRKGLGVGLPLARRTAERLGGALHLYSQPGVGTRAVLTLPLKALAE